MTPIWTCMPGAARSSLHAFAQVLTLCRHGHHHHERLPNVQMCAAAFNPATSRHIAADSYVLHGCADGLMSFLGLMVLTVKE